MSKIVRDIAELVQAGLEPMEKSAVNAAQHSGAFLMGVTTEAADIATACGWDGASALFALGPRARERLATAFDEAEDRTATSWLKQEPTVGVARVLVIQPDATLFLSWAGERLTIDHQSPVDWEPCFYASVPKPS